jgi:protein-tyrosine phosphatase
MIDLHCHMLPGIDDGAPDLATALEMARIAVADGIQVVACTPHIYPGMYENTATGIRQEVERFRLRLAEADIPLQLTYGADTHLAPDLLARMRAGEVPTLHGTRYFLLEPPHHVAPPRLEEFVFNLLAAGYVPIITHPERLSWISSHYTIFRNMAEHGAWMQITAGSLTGRFGEQVQYWAELMLDEGLVHILATDAHGVKGRAPLLAEGCCAAERWVGAEEARKLVLGRPNGILQNLDPEKLRLPASKATVAKSGYAFSLWKRLFRRAS